MAVYVPPHKRRPTFDAQKPRRYDNNDDGDKDNDDARFILNAFSSIRCINLDRRTDKWKTILHRQVSRIPGLHVERFSAVDGASMAKHDDDDVLMEWDTSKNALWDRKIPTGETRVLSTGEVGCALSHIGLWKQLAQDTNVASTMLILEDDACFLRDNKKQDRARGFLKAFRKVWTRLPDDWGLLYLGFSDRGERQYILQDAEVEIFRPTYGFHTHAYAITQSAASVLLAQLPVQGPLDVWLADNEWFGLPVYCTVVPNKGWNRCGAPLIYQDRRSGHNSDISQSGRLPAQVPSG